MKRAQCRHDLTPLSHCAKRTQRDERQPSHLRPTTTTYVFDQVRNAAGKTIRVDLQPALAVPCSGHPTVVDVDAVVAGVAKTTVDERIGHFFEQSLTAAMPSANVTKVMLRVPDAVARVSDAVHIALERFPRQPAHRRRPCQTIVERDRHMAGNNNRQQTVHVAVSLNTSRYEISSKIAVPTARHASIRRTLGERVFQRRPKQIA